MIFLSLKRNKLQFSKRGRIIYLTVIERFSQLAAEIAAFVAPLNGGINMSTLTIDEQHEGRNAILKISGHLNKLKKECNIPDQDYVLILARLKIIDDIFKDCNK
jgi:hypothetical protein